MPIQIQQQWREYLTCPVCYSFFNDVPHQPISLLCSHTVCKTCLAKFNQKKCPVDQTAISHNYDELPVNYALLQLVGIAVPNEVELPIVKQLGCHIDSYKEVKKNIEELALFLKPQLGSTMPTISLPMQRKLVTLITCQLIEEEGQIKAMRAARSLGDRAVTELLLHHQNPQQLAPNLWAAVRNRGCQFLGPAMQEEVLKLILLAQEEGHPLSRKVLVLFVVQRLEPHYSQASKTAIGHVVQLLYRASCFKVMKRDEESSLMQLKEEFRTYEALRREHDTQIVQIALEAGLRITPEQWSSLLYGDTAHKSHMQSIIDKLQTAQSFCQSVGELMMALQRSGDPTSLSLLQPHLEILTNIDISHEVRIVPTWDLLIQTTNAVLQMMRGFDEFMQQRNARRHDVLTSQSPKYKTSLCRDLQIKGKCPRGNNCTFAHSQEELDRFRARNKKLYGIHSSHLPTNRAPTSSALTPQETAELAAITKATQEKLKARNLDSDQPTTALGGSYSDLTSAGRLLSARSGRFDISSVSDYQGSSDSFQQQQMLAQCTLRQGHRCPSGGELSQFYSMQNSMQVNQPYGDYLSPHGIFGRGDYVEPVTGYATWHPHGSNAPKRAACDLFPTLAQSTIQSQSADRVHSSSLHINDLWHPMDQLAESQDSSPVKSVEQISSFDSGWTLPSSSSHASFFTGDEPQGSLSPHHDNISDDSGLDVDRHYHTWSSDEGRHANRPSILPKDKPGPNIYHSTNTIGTNDGARLRNMLEKDDYIPWEESGGRFGPISRYAKPEKKVQSTIPESSSLISNGFSSLCSRSSVGRMTTLAESGDLIASSGYSSGTTSAGYTSSTTSAGYTSSAIVDTIGWPNSRIRSDSMPSNSRNWLPLQRQQQQPLSDFPDQFRKMQIADHNSPEINTPYSDQFQYELGNVDCQQLTFSIDKQSSVASVPGMDSYLYSGPLLKSSLNLHSEFKIQ